LIASYPQLDWDAVVRQSRKLGTERILFLSLLLAHDVIGTTIPSEVLARAQADPWAGRLSKLVHTRIENELPRLPALNDYVLFHLMAREHLSDRVKYVWRRFTTTSWEDWVNFPLPDRLFPLYNVLRPALLGVKVLRFVRVGPEALGARGGRLSQPEPDRGH
jgi:hypothetical protein